MTNAGSPRDLKSAVARFCQGDLTVDSGDDGQIKSYLDSTQEKPYLIDSVLPECVGMLANAYLQNPQYSARLMDILYYFCKTRGSKTVMQFLPSDPKQLVPLVDLLQQNQLEWTTRYCLLLWLAACIFTPFRLEVLGDKLFEKVFNLAETHLGVSGLERDAAALLLSRLVTRDAPPQIAAFWAIKNKHSLGYLRSASYVALKSTPEFDNGLFDLADSINTGSPTEHRYALKIKTRIALHNFDFFEPAISAAMDALSSPSTAVRYSAAKSVARISAKLAETDLEPAQEISDALLDIFDNNVLPDGRLDLVSDSEWHGSLLALAEVLRRSLPVQLDRVSAILRKALFFEQKRSTFSLGINVRDAACYVCWSLFRCAKLPSSQLTEIYGWLISLACFDREVNVRRAAAAALQEGFGRQKCMPPEKVMSFMELLNFQSVAQISRCYLDIAPALEPDYGYLLQHGLLSWDPSTRRLAAQSVSLLKVPAAEVAKLYSKSDKDSQHGVLIALSLLNAPEDLVSPLLDVDLSSDILCEAALYAMKSAPRYELISQCLMSSEKYTVDTAATIIPDLDIPQSLLDEWEEKMQHSPTFVTALAAKNCQESLKKACGLSDPESRKTAVSFLDNAPESYDLVLQALDDYSTDTRGDVGSWVRSCAINWTKKNPSDDATAKLWRIAAEPLDKLRLEASQALTFITGAEFDYSSPENYYCRLFELAESTPLPFLSGYVQSCGAIRASKETLNGSLFGAVKYARSHDTKWLGALLRFDLKEKHGRALLATLARLTEYGVTVAPPLQLLPIAYNGSINTRNVQRLLPSIALLAMIPAPRAKQRLVKLLNHPVGAARMRAAEALAEMGVELAELVETEWENADFQEAARVAGVKISIL